VGSSRKLLGFVMTFLDKIGPVLFSFNFCKVDLPFDWAHNEIWHSLLHFDFGQVESSIKLFPELAFHWFSGELDGGEIVFEIDALKDSFGGIVGFDEWSFVDSTDVGKDEFVEGKGVASLSGPEEADFISVFLGHSTISDGVFNCIPECHVSVQTPDSLPMRLLRL